MQKELVYSIVIPIYNEEDNILPLIDEIEAAMLPYNGTWELIYVDDGSSDKSQTILKKLSHTKPHIRTLCLKKNYGQSSALFAGIRSAKGKWVISLDGDGQNDPADITRLIQAIDDYDLVTGIRKKRKDTLYKKLISKLAYQMRKVVLSDQTQDSGCSLKMMRKSCIDQIIPFRGMHRFLPALFQIHGFKTYELAVNHRERMRGKSKYHLFNRGFSLLSDLLAVAWMKKRHLTYEIEQEIQ